MQSILLCFTELKNYLITVSTVQLRGRAWSPAIVLVLFGILKLHEIQKKGQTLHNIKKRLAIIPVVSICFWTQRPKFAPGAVHTELAMDEGDTGYVSLRIFRPFSQQYSSTGSPYQFVYYSGWTMGPVDATFLRRHSFTPPLDNQNKYVLYSVSKRSLFEIYNPPLLPELPNIRDTKLTSGSLSITESCTALPISLSELTLSSRKRRAKTKASAFTTLLLVFWHLICVHYPTGREIRLQRAWASNDWTVCQ
jgi:hypothetical protein